MPFVAVSVVAFVFAFVGSLPLAGPIALLVVSSSASQRYEEARRIAFGAAVAEGIYAFLAFWGFATFLARYAVVLPISHGVTAVILGGLGARFVFFKVGQREPKASERPRSGRFWVGFSISAFNPTLLVTWSAVTTFLYSKQLFRFTGALAVPFGLFAAAGIATWGLTMVALLRHFRLPRGALTWIVRGMGVAMIGIALSSGVELGRYLLAGPPRGTRVTNLPAATLDGDDQSTMTERRARRSSIRFEALALFLESQRAKLGARALTVTTRTGRLLAAAGPSPETLAHDAIRIHEARDDGTHKTVDVATWWLRAGGFELVLASRGGRLSHDLGSGVRRILTSER